MEPTTPAFRPGTEVQFTGSEARESARVWAPLAGVVVRFDPDLDGEAHYYVRFPGVSGTAAVPAQYLEPCEEFPPVHTSTGFVSGIDDTETALVAACGRCVAKLDLGLPPSQADVDDRQVLSEALGRICGLPPQEMICQLAEQINQATTDAFVAAAPAADKRQRATELAAKDLTTDGGMPGLTKMRELQRGSVQDYPPIPGAGRWLG
jgi:hypothetical protein